MNDNLAPWFAIYTIHERRAYRALMELRLDIFRPTRMKWTRHGRQKRLEAVPLLDAYIIARIPEQGFRSVLACEHVSHIISSGGQPRAIPDDVLDPIRVLAASGRLDEREPATKARPRSIRRKGLKALEVWFTEAGASVVVAEAA